MHKKKVHSIEKGKPSLELRGRLWIDGKRVIDRWVDQGETETTARVTLEAGRKVPIVFEYYQRGGAAAARLLWSGPGQPRALIAPDQLSPIYRRWF